MDGDGMTRYSPDDGIISNTTAQMADEYCRWDDSTTWNLGYSFLPKTLSLDFHSGIHLLDLGCYWNRELYYRNHSAAISC